MKFIIVSVFCVISFLCYSQEKYSYKAIYEYEIKKEKIIKNFKKKNKNISNPRLIEKSLQLFLKSKPTEAVLYFDRKFSFYDVIERLDFENNNYAKIDPSYASAGRNIKIYNEAKNNFLVEYQENSVFKDYNEYQIKYKCKEFKVTGKKKKINNFNCIQATTKDNSGNEVKVWFTPDISTSFGPKRFCNLPGLIVLIDAYSYKAVLKSIKKYNKKIETHPKDVIFIDTITLNKLSQNSFDKVFQN